MVNIYFTDLEKEDFLLDRGYCLVAEWIEVEENVYQNTFVTSRTIRVRAFRGDYVGTLEEAFNKEIKYSLLNNSLWKY